MTESFPNKVDLSKFMDGITDTYKTRRSKGTSDLHLEVVDATQETFTVTYRKNQTDPRVIGRTGDINTILEWASTLSEPVMMRSAEVCERFQLHPSTLKEIRYQLVNLGYGVTVTKGKSIVFPPNTCGLRASTQADHTKSFSRWLDLNSDLGYLLGYWLGDGHIAKQDGLDYGIFGIVYSNNVPTSARSGSELKSIISKLGFPCSETFTDLNNMTLLSVYHDAMVRWVASNFGHVCEDKHLPDWIYDAPKDFLLGILRGFVDSDGSVFQKKDGSISVGLNNTNALLMEQLFLVCTSFGIPVSKTKPTSSEWVKFPDGSLCWSKALHIIHFTHAPSVKSFFESGHLSKRKDPTMWKDGRSGTRHVVHGGKLYYRVNKVDNSEHTGAVYSLNVHDDHTFFAGNTGTCNCLRTLYYMDKLRQAQSQIADRAMTPKRIVWAEDISDADADELREQVDLSLVDPDYSIVANYEIHWEEMGSKDRLLDLTAEYEQGERRLRTGLGVTESLLSGETLYSGDRLKLEVINTRYLLLREELQEYVQEYLFAPVARRKGFVEKDKWGDEVVLHPNLSFTRLPLRDSQDTYDALFNLYAKGSISIDLILEMFNIDPDDTARKIKNDTFTVNDAIFNEMTRALYGAVGSALAEKTDVMDKMAQYLGLKMKEESAPQDPGRFG